MADRVSPGLGIIQGTNRRGNPHVAGGLRGQTQRGVKGGARKEEKKRNKKEYLERITKIIIYFSFFFQAASINVISLFRKHERAKDL